MSNLIVFLVIGAFYIVSALVQAAAKQAKDKESSRRGQRQASNNFMEEMQRRAAEQQRRQESQQEAPIMLRQVQRPEGRGQALKARVVARPARQAPAQANVTTPARARHLHSRLEGERDLSDVDERHLSHLTGNLRSQEETPETERESAPRGGRALGNQKVANYNVDESIDIETIGAHLSPMQRALVLSEILTRRPAFESDDSSSLF